MSEADTLFAALRQSAGDDIAALLERMVRDAPDHALNKINALDLAAKEGVSEEHVIAALLNAVGLGIFEMSWNVMWPKKTSLWMGYPYFPFPGEPNAIATVMTVERRGRDES